MAVHSQKRLGEAWRVENQKRGRAAATERRCAILFEDARDLDGAKRSDSRASASCACSTLREAVPIRHGYLKLNGMASERWQICKTEKWNFERVLAEISRRSIRS